MWLSIRVLFNSLLTTMVLLVWMGCAELNPAFALSSPHPLQLYENGIKILESYRGNPSHLYQAEQYFAQLIERYPDSPFGYLGISRVYRVKAYLYGNHYDMGLIREEALPYAVKALELGPSIRAVHENYAQFEKIFEEFSSQRKKIQEYIYLFPDHPETFYAVANFVFEQNEYEKAIEYYEAALELSPTDALQLKIFNRIGLIFMERLGQPEKAIEYYQKALAIWAESPMTNEYLGLAYLKTKDYPLAIEHLSKTLKWADTANPSYHLLEAKGYLAEQKGKIEQAIEFLERACQYAITNSQIHYRLGNLYFEKANYQSAYDHFKSVIDLEPQKTEAYYFAGRSAHSLGNTDQAMDYYRKFLQLDSEGQEAEWIRKNIPDLSHNKLSE